MNLIAKTFQGLEEVLAKELTELGADNIQIGTRMVSFTGDQETLYRANFCLRTAVKVLKTIKQFTANDADEIYAVVKEMPWEELIDEKNTFLVESVVYSETFRHSKFVAYRVKDAVADRFMERCGQRPNVSLSNPDLRINVHVAENDVTISLDSSGESLHKRGYRTGTVAAPINEVLAAGLIKLSGWDGSCDLVDPFCGSGTIAIEAALIALNIYPGVFREEFAFERWRDFDEELLQRIYDDDSQEREFLHHIYGFDINRQAVAIAQDNVRSAGVNKVVEIQQQDFYNFEWDQRAAIMITNPPYGERITTNDLLDLYATIGQRLKQQFVGNDAWIISSNEECFIKIGFRPSTKYALYNGAIPCEFRRYQVFDGKLSERRSEGLDIKTDEERQRNAKFRSNRRSEDKGHSKPEFRPLFEGDEEPKLNRHNFKWGDRGSDYEDAHDRHSHRTFERGDRKERGDKKDFKGHGDHKDFKKGGNFKGHGDRKDFKKRSESKDGKDFKGKRRDEETTAQWGFDAEGRPFRK